MKSNLSGIFVVSVISICAAVMVDALHFPGLVPQEHTLLDQLNIEFGSQLIPSNEDIARSGSKVTDFGDTMHKIAKRQRFNVPYELAGTYDVCMPMNEGKEVFNVSKSPISGSFGDKTMLDSTYKVNLEQSRDVINKGKKSSGAGCQFLCQKTWNAEEIRTFHNLVKEGYGYRMYLDDLPSATTFDEQTHYDKNIPLGFVRESKNANSEESWGDEFKDVPEVAIYNHLDIRVMIHPTYNEAYASGTPTNRPLSLDVPLVGKVPIMPTLKSIRIVGFEVTPKSKPWKSACSEVQSNPGYTYADEEIENAMWLVADEPFSFTYNVEFVKSDKDWPTRLDHYMNYGRNNLHWEQIAISMTIILAMTFVTCQVISSALSKDSDTLDALRKTYRQRWRLRRRQIRGAGNARFDAVDAEDSSSSAEVTAPLKREVAWKKLQPYVFRKPEWALALSVLLGAGIQILLTVYSAIMCSIGGTFSVANPVLMLSLVVTLFPCFAIVNGFVAAKFYTFWNGSDWMNLAFFAAISYPSFVGICFTIIDVSEWVQTKRASFVPMSEILLISILYLFINGPTTVLGTYLGFKSPKMVSPVKTSRIDSLAPKVVLPFWLSPCITVPICGLLPTLVISIEFDQILSGVQGSQYIYMIFWFAYLTSLIFLIVVVECAIIQQYLHLCYEEYRWWWRTFTLGSSVGVFIFALLCYHLLFEVAISHMTSLVIYLAAAVLVSVSAGLMTGALALIAGFFFTKQIYTMTKND